jgi:polyisoprenyl-teichoic acid--peptidoglycan teichoic acid transferase
MDRILKRKYIPLVSKITILGIFVVFLFFLVQASIWSVRFMSQTGITPGLLVKLVFDDGARLQSSRDRINVLVLGIGGGTHDGADLTDTMMVLSVDRAKKTMAFISVPRDIWADSLKAKVNTAYHYGEEKQKGGGLILAKATVEDVVGLPIHYAVVIDFSGFQKLIDQVGGVDVNVEHAFTDPDYPIAGKEHDSCPGDPTNRCVYETIHFDAGLQHMDGETALKYSRSRHAVGAEGSDFARGNRQQDIMIALKNKLVHPFAWVTPSRLATLPKVLDDATDMDLNIAEAVTLGKLFVAGKTDQIKKISFEDRLDNPSPYLYDNQYVLTPQEDWESIHAYIKEQLH